MPAAAKAVAEAFGTGRPDREHGPWGGHQIHAGWWVRADYPGRRVTSPARTGLDWTGWCGTKGNAKDTAWGGSSGAVSDEDYKNLK